VECLGKVEVDFIRAALWVPSAKWLRMYADVAGEATAHNTQPPITETQNQIESIRATIFRIDATRISSGKL
jgi:hypothetical protein